MGNVRIANVSSGLSAYLVKYIGMKTLLQLGLSLLLLAVPFHSVVVLPGVSVVKAIGLVFALNCLIWLVVKLRESHWLWIIPPRCAPGAFIWAGGSIMEQRNALAISRRQMLVWIMGVLKLGM